MLTAGWTPWPLVTLAIAATAAAITACGDGSTSAADFVAGANQVCRETEREFERIQRRPPRSAEQAEAQAEALAEVSEQALDELRSIEAPDGVKPAYERYLDARETALGQIEDGRDAAADKNAQAYAKAKRKVSQGQATRLQLAREVGLRACSRPSVTLDGG